MTIDHVMPLAERLTREADRLDPPYLHEFNEKGQRLGHHPHAYLLRKAAATILHLEDELLKARSAFALAAEDDAGRAELLRNAEKDSARYRWLRGEGAMHEEVLVFSDECLDRFIDAAIDAALKNGA